MSVAAQPVVEQVETPVVEEDNLDNFASAFEELSKLGDKPVTAEAIAGKPPVAAPAAPETPAEDEAGLPDPEAQVAAAEAAAAGGEETPPPPPVKPQMTTEEVLDKLAERLTPKPPAPAPQQQQRPAEPDFSADEAAFIANYAKEFPDVAKAEALIRRSEYKHVVDFVFKQVHQQLGPMAQMLSELATNAQLAALENTVEDYADVRTKVVEWAGKQPEYLKAAYNQVIQHGTVDQVADLIERWRKDTGSVGLQAQQQQANTRGHKDTELPSAAKQAAARLAPVSSKRSQVVSAPSKDDFEGAFTNFANET